MQDYIFHVHHDGRAEPDVLEVAVRDDARAEELARQRLSLSDGHKAVEVWRMGRLMCRISRGDSADYG
jgi:hypothetical protein